MANIQAALNSMLSSAQAGAFLYSQTPEFKKRGEIQALQSQRKAQEMESEHIENIITDDTKSQEARHAAAEREAELAGEEYRTIKDLYKLTGDESLYKDILARVPSKQGELGRELYEQEALEKADKDEKALKEQKEKAAKQRAQKEALEIRRRILEGTVPTDRFTELMKEER